MKKTEAFQTALDTATLRAAVKAAAQYSGEGIYSFALYTSNEYSYVIATVSTTVGLRTVAKRYMAQYNFEAPWDTFEGAEKELKWSPCDSPHHDVFSEEFHEAQALLEELWNATDMDSYEEFEKTTEAVHAAFIRSLGKVREAGVLDRSVVLNLLMGDQSDEERLENATALNSPDTLAGFGKDLGT